jgi:hypothetical protein
VFGLVVRFELLEGHEEAFDGLVAETLPEIRAKEPGTCLYVTRRGVTWEQGLLRVLRGRAGFPSPRGDRPREAAPGRPGAPPQRRPRGLVPVLRRWRPDWLTKSRQWSTTLGALRRARQEWVEERRRLRQGERGAVPGRGRVEASWTFFGTGWSMAGDAYMAEQAGRALAEAKRFAREQRHTEFVEGGCWRKCCSRRRRRASS